MRNMILRFAFLAVAALSTPFLGMALTTHADDDTDEVWVEVGELAQPLASTDAAVYVDADRTLVYITGGKQQNGSAAANITLLEFEDGEPIGFGAVGPLPVPLYGHAAVVACKRLYIIGGWDGIYWHPEVWSSDIRPNGALGPWRTEIGYPFPVTFHDAVVIGNECAGGQTATIYVLGGEQLENGDSSAGAAAAGKRHPLPDLDHPMRSPQELSHDTTDQVFYSEVGSDGVLSTWRATARPLPEPLRRHAAVVYGGSIIVTGGYDGEQVMSTVYVARATSRSLDSWQTGELAQPVEYHQSAVANGKLWILGGRRREGHVLDDVYMADLSPLPTASDWVNEKELPEDLYRAGAFTLTNPPEAGIYLVGGIDDEGEYEVDILHHTPVGFAGFVLQNEPGDLFAPADIITYTVTFHSGGLPMQEVTVDGPVPDGTEALTPHTWAIDTVAADTTNIFTYSVRRTAADAAGTAPVTNPGAIVRWHYGGTSYQMQSNTTFNAGSVLCFLPFVSDD